MPYTMTVVTNDGGIHKLPADTVTFETPPKVALHVGGPLLPLAFRSSRDAFYIRGVRWPELGGQALHVRAVAPPART